MTEFEFKRMVWKECLAYRVMKGFYRAARHIMREYRHDIVNSVMCPVEAENDARMDYFAWMMLAPAWPAFILSPEYPQD